MHEIMRYQFIKDICALPFVKALYLFGSRARETNGERSDIDLAIDTLEKALLRLEEAVLQPADAGRFIIDATIQRFKFTYELSWKTLKRFLQVEGIVAKSPRQTVKEAYQIGWLDGEEEWLQMLEDRNLMSHVYQETLADEIYSWIPAHAKAIRAAFTKLPR